MKLKRTMALLLGILLLSMMILSGCAAKETEQAAKTPETKTEVSPEPETTEEADPTEAADTAADEEVQEEPAQDAVPTAFVPAADDTVLEYTMESPMYTMEFDLVFHADGTGAMRVDNVTYNMASEDLVTFAWTLTDDSLALTDVSSGTFTVADDMVTWKGDIGEHMKDTEIPYPLTKEDMQALADPGAAADTTVYEYTMESPMYTMEFDLLLQNDGTGSIRVDNVTYNVSMEDLVTFTWSTTDGVYAFENVSAGEFTSDDQTITWKGDIGEHMKDMEVPFELNG